MVAQGEFPPVADEFPPAAIEEAPPVEMLPPVPTTGVGVGPGPGVGLGQATSDVEASIDNVIADK